MTPLILQNVRKMFGSVRAVDGVSLSIPGGVIFGMLGPNGAGKTTTIRMVMDIIRPDSGRIEVLGFSQPSAAKNRVGYLPEERGLYRKMRVRKVLEYVAVIHGVRQRRARQMAEDWLGKVALGGWADRRVEELSKGMQQKLQLAAALVHDPELVILDEPFAGLDPVNVEELSQMVLQLKQQGRTVVFSTHMMEQAEKLCDEIVLINRGRTVLEGRVSDIRDRHATSDVIVECDDGGAIEDLAGVVQVVPKAGHVELVLEEGADPQQILRGLVERVRVKRFELKRPSLHEIFIRAVRGKDE